MKISVNGCVHDVQHCTLMELLEYLQLAQKRIAVERNGVLVRRAEFLSTQLCEGDVLEIVGAVGGG